MARKKTAKAASKKKRVVRKKRLPFPSELRLLVPDNEAVSATVPMAEYSRIRQKVCELGGRLETNLKTGVVRFKSGGAMPKMYFSSAINQKLDSPVNRQPVQ